MASIKIPVENEELAAVARLADHLHVSIGDLAYTAINRIMLQADEPAVRADIVDTRGWRGKSLPEWSDSARAARLHAPAPEDEREPSAPLKP
jgi:hypothetical protein